MMFQKVNEAANNSDLTVESIVSALGGRMLVAGEHSDAAVRHVVASDLMSEVLLADEDDLLMVTGLATEHVVRTAHVLGAVGVVLAGGFVPSQPMLRVAEELGVTLAQAPGTRNEIRLALLNLLGHAS